MWRVRYLYLHSLEGKAPLIERKRGKTLLRENSFCSLEQTARFAESKAAAYDPMSASSFVYCSNTEAKLQQPPPLLQANYSLSIAQHSQPKPQSCWGTRHPRGPHTVCLSLQVSSSGGETHSNSTIYCHTTQRTDFTPLAPLTQCRA